MHLRHHLPCHLWQRLRSALWEWGPPTLRLCQSLWQFGQRLCQKRRLRQLPCPLLVDWLPRLLLEFDLKLLQQLLLSKGLALPPTLAKNPGPGAVAWSLFVLLSKIGVGFGCMSSLMSRAGSDDGIDSISSLQSLPGFLCGVRARCCAPQSRTGGPSSSSVGPRLQRRVATSCLAVPVLVVLLARLRVAAR